VDHAPRRIRSAPAAPAALGEWYIQQVLNTLVSNPAVWAKDGALHQLGRERRLLRPCRSADTIAGTSGEIPDCQSRYPLMQMASPGPIGLGVRVPMLVVSPFSVGGWVCSDTFDHTSQLRFLETRFGDVTVAEPVEPGVGRLTGGPDRPPYRSSAHPSPKPPHLPLNLGLDHDAPDQQRVHADPAVSRSTSTSPQYPLKKKQKMPVQADRFAAPDSALTHRRSPAVGATAASSCGNCHGLRQLPGPSMAIWPAGVGRWGCGGPRPPSHSTI